MNRWPIFRVLSLALASACGGEVSSAPQAAGSVTVAPDLDLITVANDEQTVVRKVGQRLTIRLWTIGPGNYGDPAVSAGSVKFIDMSFVSPPNPGGPTQDYRFLVESAGTVVIQIKHTVQAKTFTVTVNSTN